MERLLTHVMLEHDSLISQVTRHSYFRVRLLDVSEVASVTSGGTPCIVLMTPLHYRYYVAKPVRLTTY